MGDAEAMFYRKKLPLVILVEIKHHICWNHAVLEGDVQPFERVKRDPYRLKLRLIHQHIVSALVTPTGSGGKRPHTTDGAIAYKFW